MLLIIIQIGISSAFSNKILCEFILSPEVCRHFSFVLWDADCQFLFFDQYILAESPVYSRDPQWISSEEKLNLTSPCIQLNV
jgi:hypothetical protein